MYNVKVGQLIIYRWKDPTASASWMDPGKIQLADIKQVGYVANIRKEALEIMDGGSDGKLNSDPNLVPWSLIYELSILEGEEWSGD